MYPNQLIPRMVFAAICAIVTSTSIFSATFFVSSDDDLTDLLVGGQVSPGDIIIWRDGTYRGQEIRFQGVNGTSGAPITLRAETPGGVKLTENSTLRFGGDHLVVDGFHWDGSFTEETIVQFRGSGNVPANDCRLTNSAITNVPEREGNEIKWILVYGQRNRIDQCMISGKTEKGAMIIVELGNLEPMAIAGHVFENNIFSEFAFSTGTNNETIRIGESEFQNWNAQCLVQNNLFYRCDGENEIISLKSQGNRILNNTFLESAGSLVMRHGDFSIIEGNYFLGNGKANTGGIRITGTNHRIVNNYLEGLTGTGWNGAMVIMNGESTGPTSSGYEKVEDVLVAHNTLVNCTGDVISYGWGRDAKGLKTLPKSTTLANNLIFGTSELITFHDTKRPTIDYTSNIFFGGSFDETSAGIINVDPEVSLADGFFRPSSSSPAANAATGDYGVATDVEGQVRGEGNDIGADEFAGATGSATGPLTASDVGPTFLGGSASFLNVSSLNVFGSEAASQDLNVSSNVDWTASPDQSWITISPTSGTGDGTIQVSVSLNGANESRSGTISITDGSLTRTVVLQQEGKGQTLEVSMSSLSFGASSGSQPIQVTSTTTWNVSSDASWITTTPSSGTNNAEVVINVTTNSAVGSRSGTVTVSGGGLSQSVLVTQEGVGATSGIEKLSIKSVNASEAQSPNVAENTIDQNLDTRWSAQGAGQHITYDLGTTFELSEIRIAFHKGDSRTATFSVAVSSDGETFTDVLSQIETSGTTEQLEAYAITGTHQYVRIIGFGNSSSEWNSITEVEIWGSAPMETGGGSGILPIADTYIRSGSFGNQSYINDEELWVKETGSADFKRRALFTFSLADIKGDVSDAKLVLTPTRLGATSDLVTTEAYGTSSWDVSTVWNDNPTFSSFQDSKLGGYAIGQSVTYDVTEWIKDNLAQNQTAASFLIKSVGPDASASYVIFASMENGEASYRPQLVISASGEQVKETITSIANQLLEGTNVEIYPNPTSESVNVSWSKPEYDRIMLFNISGTRFMQASIIGRTSKSLSVSKLKQGIYFIILEGTSKREAFRIKVN